MFDVSSDCESADVINLCAVGVVAMLTMPGTIDCDCVIFCGRLDVSVVLALCCCPTFKPCVTGDDDPTATN